METNEIKTNQEIQQDWLQSEAKEIEENKFSGELLPALSLEEGKVTTFEVDFGKPFEKWTDPDSKMLKKIIPVTHNEQKMVLWLNVKNPLYGEIVAAGVKGQKVFKVMRTGQKQNTRYTLVKE